MRFTMILCLLPMFIDSQPPRIEMDGDSTHVKITASLPADGLKGQPAGHWSQDQGETWLRFCLVKKDGLGQPLLGVYQLSDNRLTFHPRTALEPGVLYRASFGTDQTKAVSADYRVPQRALTAPATVVKILPTSAILPANHLKFYICFSAPMRGGADIFDQIRILDADGNEVRDPWLRDELWDEKDQRLIIYIHPGRIKWGLLLREMLGPVLVPGKEYSLVVKGTLLDAQGQKLGKDTVKKFRTTAEERTLIPLADWKLSAPAIGSREPLVLETSRVIDHTCMTEDLTIKDGKGRIVQGTIAPGRAEKSWLFTPQNPWQAGEHTLHVHPRLEDVAGNTPTRAFDVDLKAPVIPPQSMEIRFQPSSK